MSTELIEDHLFQVEEAIPKMKELIADLKLCNSKLSKMVLMSALKKISRPLLDFKMSDSDE